MWQNIDPFWLFVLIGFGLFSGLLAGLLGIGGGLVIVPALIWLLPKFGVPSDYIMHVALATSMATICFTSISSARAHHKRGAVSTSRLKLILPGIALGGLLGAYLADLLNSLWLARIFGGFAIIMGLRMLLNKMPEATGCSLMYSRSVPETTAMGALSALVGIGGGSLIVPYMLYHKEELIKAIGTAAACGLPLAIMATIGYVVFGWNEPEFADYQIGYVNWLAVGVLGISSMISAPFGAYLAHKLATKIIKIIFALLLIIIGLKIIITNF